MRKIIEIDPYFPTGEVSVQPVVLWANGRPCYEQFTKHASVANDYFKTITPVPGHSIVYVLALGSWEFYGENRNGDGFPESAYNAHLNPPWIRDEDTLVRHYKTFESAHNFRHHRNTDPAKSVGKVLKAFWNPTMHRVELVVDLDNAKAPDLADRIKSGEFPPVSMGTRVPYDVCVTPDTLVRTSEGYKTISDIKVGDAVRTHTGKIQRVRDTFTRIADNLLEVTASGVAPIKCTATHPFYVLRKETMRMCHGSANGQKLRHKVTSDGGACARCNRPVTFNPEWCSAEDLCVGDYLLTPVDPCPEQCNVSVEAAYALGMYVGDGCRIRETRENADGERVQCGLSFSLSSEQPKIHKKLVESLNAVAENPANTYAEGNGKKAFAVTVHDEGLSHWMTDHAGVFSRGKRLSEEAFGWSAEIKRAFIGGYIDSDGTLDSCGVLRIATVNRGMAYDTQRVLHSLGVPASVSYGGHTTNDDYGSDTDYYYIFIPAAYAGMFAAHSVKAAGNTVTTAYASSRSFFFSGYWCTPIKAIEELPGESEVYNLSVEGDESYIAEGLAVHNCSICGNRAPTRAQYCNHLKFQMRDVIDGKKVAALNPSPRFFDISWVFRPADPTAFMLKKVANNHAYEIISGAAAGEYLDSMELQKQAAKKLAVIDKVVEGVGVDSNSLPESVPQQEYDNLVKMRPYAMSIAENTPDLPEETIQKLSAYPLAEIMSSGMYAGGIQLSPAEILKVSAYQAGLRNSVTGAMLEKAAAIQSRMIGIFEEYPQVVGQLVKSGSVALDLEHVNPAVVEIFTPYIEKRGGMYEYLKRRVVPEDWRDEAANTTLLTITDPATGERYYTTRGAAVAAHDEIAKANLVKTLGGAALLGGAYKLVGSALPAAGLARPALAGGLAAIGATSLPSMGTHYMTEQGVAIPQLTELQKVSSGIAMPTLTALGIMAALAYDQKRRSYSDIPIGHPALPASRRVLDNLGEFTTNHPILSLLGGTAALAPVMRSKGVSSLARKLRNHVEPAISGTWKGLRGEPITVKTSEAESAVLLPDVNLNKLAMDLGNLIVGD